MTSCSSICTSWIAISSSCPPLACTNALLWPFRCAVWPFVALLQYEAWSGICVATIYDSSPCRDCRPAAPHKTATDIIASAPMLHTLLNAALSCATKRAYRRAISSYANFCRFHFPVVPVFPASACVLGAFIAHLPSQRYAPATFMTYVSAISHVHRLAGKVDPTQLFVINKLLVGAKKLSYSDTRLPISLSILRKFVDATKFMPPLLICDFSDKACFSWHFMHFYPFPSQWQSLHH